MLILNQCYEIDSPNGHVNNQGMRFIQVCLVAENTGKTKYKKQNLMQ